MPSVRLHPSGDHSRPTHNPLPQILQTPSGLALLELQGVINLPEPPPEGGPKSATSIGRLDFPGYRPNSLDPSNTSWMKKIYLYVGEHQRLAGEAKKLLNPFAVIRRRDNGASVAPGGAASEHPEELEVVEIVKYKLVFSQRPEPVGTLP